jgi:hypothetical protein
MFSFSICFISFISLFLSSLFLFLSGFYFVLNDLIYFIEWEDRLCGLMVRVLDYRYRVPGHYKKKR